MSVSYQLGVDSAIILKYGTVDQAVVAGLNKLGPPGMSRDVLSVDEFRNDFARQFASAGKYGEITFGGNYVLGDTTGQDLLKSYLVAKTKLTQTDFMGFFNLNDFFTTDLANDSISGIQITEFMVGEVDKNGIYELSGKAVCNGRMAVYTAHIIDGATPTMAFVSGTPDTITDSASGFVTAGFAAGQSLIIVNSTSNDAVYTTIASVAAGTLTLASTTTLTSEAAVEGTELHGGTV